jgi:hypothetical protein
MSHLGDSLRISKEIENIIEQLADREKELLYTSKNKKIKGKAYSTYHIH